MAGAAFLLSFLLAAGAAELPLSPGRDAVLFRAADPGQLGLFLPREDGSFELRWLPPFAVPIERLALEDADGDGDLDLALALRDGTLALWLGDGRGEFVPREQEAPDGHAHHGHGILAPALSRDEESRVRELLARPRAGGIVARPRLLTPHATHTVFVGQGGTTFSPSTVNVQVGDTVHWVWSTLGHNVVSGTGCTNDNLFCSPSDTNCGANPTSGAGATYDRVFSTVGSFPYFCRPHCFFGMTGTVNVAAAAADVLEATELRVEKGPDPGETRFTFTPACGASGHALYLGEGSLAAGPVWTQSLCADASGVHVASPPDPSGLQYFVVVGQNATVEGSYGTGIGGAERPEAVGVGACERPRMISTSCGDRHQ